VKEKCPKILPLQFCKNYSTLHINEIHSPNTLFKNYILEAAAPKPAPLDALVHPIGAKVCL
jgi:hypothetical protein